MAIELDKCQRCDSARSMSQGSERAVEGQRRRTNNSGEDDSRCAFCSETLAARVSTATVRAWTAVSLPISSQSLRGRLTLRVLPVHARLESVQSRVEVRRGR